MAKPFLYNDELPVGWYFKQERGAGMWTGPFDSEALVKRRAAAMCPPAQRTVRFVELVARHETFVAMSELEGRQA